MILRKTLVLHIALLCSCLLAAPGFTQEEQEDRWYRVELLIFSNESSAAGSAERWPPEPALAYPGRYRFLVDPQQLEANGEPSPTGVQTMTQLPAVNSTAREPAPKGVEGEIPVTPTPFVVLPRDQLEFARVASTMRRRGNQSVLFHNAWMQPVGKKSVALPLVIDDSGNRLAWPRLQGSILLHLSRYLHLEPNLWLNTSGDYLPGDWRMPPPPLGPASLVPLEPDAEPEPAYTWRHAVLLNEKRRMRSNEVHYLDHPMLGLVIKLTPLPTEELRLLALAEYEAGRKESASAVSASRDQGL